MDMHILCSGGIRLRVEWICAHSVIIDTSTLPKMGIVPIIVQFGRTNTSHYPMGRLSTPLKATSCARGPQLNPKPHLRSDTSTRTRGEDRTLPLLQGHHTGGSTTMAWQRRGNRLSYDRSLQHRGKVTTHSLGSGSRALQSRSWVPGCCGNVQSSDEG